MEYRELLEENKRLRLEMAQALKWQEKYNRLRNIVFKLYIDTEELREFLDEELK